MATIINLNLFPSATGYSFTDTDGSRHSSDSWRNLTRKVTDYRTRNGKPIGDVFQDIMDQICAAIPDHCYDNAPRPAPVPTAAKPKLGRNVSGLAARVLAWVGWVLKEKRSNRLVKVPAAEAARRAAICKACPMQAPLTSGCPTCSGTISSGRKAVMSGERYADDSLAGCAALIEDTKISVHLVLPAPPPNSELPAPCWRQ